MKLKSYKFRLYPTPSQERKFWQTFGCVRLVWNYLLELFNLPAQLDCTCNPLKKHDPTIKQLKEQFPFLAEVSQSALGMVLHCWIATKEQYFSTTRKKKLGHMKFKSRKGRQSFTLPDKTRFKVWQDSHQIRLEKIGLVKYRDSRVIPADAVFKSVTISFHNGRYFASVLVEQNIEEKPSTDKKVGIDVGLKIFCTDSDGHQFQHPHYQRDNQAKLARVQMFLAKKVKGSSRYKKNQRRIQRIWNNITDSRSWFLNQVSNYYIDRCDEIAVEELNISGMMKNHCLAGAISDSAWGELFRQLEYKAEWYGRTVLKAPRFEPTSQTCSNCGNKQAMPLSNRIYHCPACGLTLDRDVNAAINIKVAGRVQPLKSDAEPEVTKAKKRPLS